ncbi:hypothetical protein [Myxosarcina sp. GI1(2024)]
MNEPPSRYVLSRELENERAIRRTAKLLQAKQARIRDDLDCLVTHLALLMPRSRHRATEQGMNAELLLEAARRLDDEIFRDLLRQIIQEKNI